MIINLTEKERQCAERYAKKHNMSLQDAFKRALFEKIEDEYDLAVCQDAYHEYLTGGRKSRPIEELWNTL